MASEVVIQQLSTHSSLDLTTTISSLTTACQARLGAVFLYQDIPHYCRELNLLKDLLTCAYKKDEGKGSTDLVKVAGDVVEKVCFGLLVNVCPTSDSRPDFLVLLGSLCRVVAVCVQINADIMSKVLELVINSINQFLKDNSSSTDDDFCTNPLDIHTSLEILRHVFNKKQVTEYEIVKTWLHHLTSKIIGIIPHISIKLVGITYMPVLLQLIELDVRHREENLHALWLYIQSFTQLGPDEAKPYVVLCGLANWFFPTRGFEGLDWDIVRDEELWKVLQKGLHNTNTLTRKRSLYLVKRIVDICQLTGAEVSTSPGKPEAKEDEVSSGPALPETGSSQQPLFWWTRSKQEELSAVWEDFMLLAEVMEEKQVHVIKPLLPRMTSLIKAASVSSQQDKPLLHTSWLTTILQRCSLHESLKIIRWSTETAFSLDLHTCPLLAQGQDKYLTGQLLLTLKETKLFSREPGSPSGHVPPLGEKLVTFMQSCWNTLPQQQRGAFFCDTVQTISSSTWGPVPLVYLCRALSLVPSCPCLDKVTITSLRKLLTGDLVTTEAYLRGAISGFLVQMMINLTDKSCVSLVDSMQILSLVHLEDCLQRGTTLWDQCARWLREDSGAEHSGWTQEDIRKHIDDSVTKYLEVTIDSKFSPGDTVAAHTIARLLLLASDASIATASASDASIATSTSPSDPDLLGQVMGKLAVIVNSINSHSYMSTHKADKAAQLLVLTVRELVPKKCAQSDPVAKVILSAVESCQAELLTYVGHQITESVKTLHDRSLLKLYTECVEMLTDVAGLLNGVDLDSLTRRCIVVLSRDIQAQVSEHTRMQQLSAMSILGRISSFLSRDLHLGSGDSRRQSLCRVITGFLQGHKVVTHFEKPSADSEVSSQEWGKITSLYLQSQWQVVLLWLQQSDSGAPTCPARELLALATETMAVGLEETSITVMHCLKILVEKTVTEGSVTDETLLEAINSCWASFREARRTTIVWSVLPGFLGVTFQPCLISKEEGSPVLELLKQTVTEGSVGDEALLEAINSCWASFREARRSTIVWSVLRGFVGVAYQPCLVSKEEGSPVLERLKECANELLSYGTEKVGVVNVLTDQLTWVWAQPGMEDHVIKFAPIMVQLCKFGSQPTRGQRQIYDASATVEALGDQCAVNSLVKSISHGDMLVRATLIDYLCTLDPSNTKHRCLATELIRLCSGCYEDVLQGASNKFANSLVHRQRHRLIQTVLLLHSFVTEDYVSELWKFLWSSLEQECQPSIRHVLEWAVVATMVRQPQFGKELWVRFDKYHDSKNAVLCSMLCVVIHLGPHLPADHQEEYYSRILPCILPWCMAHHFTTRIFAQATLCKLWNQCRELQLDNILGANTVLQALVDFNQVNRNSTTNVKKLLDSFFFRSLDFKKDFTLEIIYHILPAVTDLSEEDWILPSLFTQVNPGWPGGQRSKFICLSRPTSHLDGIEFGKWKYTTIKIFEDMEAGGDGTVGDVQKKIQPWKQMSPDLETTEEIEHGVRSHEEGGLVVVTSLINKVPNLGGLCRTSEIFGVSEYVLDKLKYTEDKMFQGLSVTAHKWLPISEVPEQMLPDYLQQKRQEGYTLVGVEQTANSVCLTDYTFPQKTLLLLGNEKEGIPVDLISLLDVCVEIPQQGVVRSLNVHVSGALLIWEYRRQQLIKAASS